MPMTGTNLEVLLEAALKNNEDVVCDNLKIFDHIKDEVIEYTKIGLKNKVMPLSAERFFRYDDPLRRYPMGIMKPVVRKEFLQTHRIMYDANHRTGEDFIFLADIILSGARTLVVPGAYYVYVDRLSPTTRKISPHSRSAHDPNSFVRGCDEILQRYASSMTKETRFALERRRRMFQGNIVHKEMVAAVRERKLFKALELVIKHPFLLVLDTAIILKLIKANILSALTSCSADREHRRSSRGAGRHRRLLGPDLRAQQLGNASLRKALCGTPDLPLVTINADIVQDAPEEARDFLSISAC
jgi:hypothetical protein